MGTTILSLPLAGLAIYSWSDPRAPYFLAGAVIYFVGTFLVTVMGNVPLNDQLAAVSATDPSAIALWDHYLVRWTQLNTLRTVAPALALAAFCAGFTR